MSHVTAQENLLDRWQHHQHGQHGREQQQSPPPEPEGSCRSVGEIETACWCSCIRCDTSNMRSLAVSAQDYIYFHLHLVKAFCKIWWGHLNGNALLYWQRKAGFFFFQTLFFQTFHMFEGKLWQFHTHLEPSHCTYRRVSTMSAGIKKNAHDRSADVIATGKAEQSRLSFGLSEGIVIRECLQTNAHLLSVDDFLIKASRWISSFS